MRSSKIRFKPTRNFFIFMTLPIIAICLFFGFRKTIATASINAQLEVQKVENQQLKDELTNWKTLYNEVYYIKEDYRQNVQDITDLLYLTKMPIGGESIDPPVKASDKLTLKVMEQTINSFREVDDSLKYAKSFLETRKAIINDTPFSYPIRTDGTVKITSAYGFRNGVFNKDKNQLKFHPGVDLSGKIGDPIQATADGVVKWIEYNNPGYGRLIIIRHQLGYETWYAHLSAIKVKLGQKIKRGELIGLMGTSGESTGPHLHYEIHIGDNPVDPLIFLSASY